MSKKNIAIKLGYDKGYRIVDGEVFYKNKIVKTYVNKDNYCWFKIRLLKGPQINISVHRLLAFQKFGDKMFDSNLQVRHLDSNPLNNKEENIELGTPSQNCMDKDLETRTRCALYATSFVKKHAHENILQMHNNGLSYKQIMSETGIKSKGTISFIINKSLVANK